MPYGEKMSKSDAMKSGGAGYMAGRKPNMKDPSCPSSGYVYGHSKHAGASPSPKRGKG